VKGKNRL